MARPLRIEFAGGLYHVTSRGNARQDIYVDIPGKQKLAPPKPIDYFKRKYSDPKQAMVMAYLSKHYTLEVVGTAFGVSYATVSRAVKSHDQRRQL
jgi:hypothetical protein